MSRHKEPAPVVLAEPGVVAPQPHNAGNMSSMKCPIDGEALVMTDRSGVEIDYCPKCRGVWLDRGELDKIIERATPAERPQPAFSRSEPERAAPSPRNDDDRTRDKRRDWDDDDREKYGRKKRGSLLGDLFDF